MSEEDEEKFTFITDEDTFCYASFRLKNVGATFQRLLDKIFLGQVSCNVEAYVEDILVWMTPDEDHIRDLEETFRTHPAGKPMVKREKMCIRSNKRPFFRISYYTGWNQTKNIKNRGGPKHDPTKNNKESTTVKQVSNLPK